jgi:hypothetical protein
MLIAPAVAEALVSRKIVANKIMYLWRLSMCNDRLEHTLQDETQSLEISATQT